MNLDPLTIIVLGIVFVSSLIRSALGFGGALVAMPLLALAVDIKIASPLVALMNNVNTIFILVSSWRQVRTASAWRLVLSSLVGIPIGLLFLKGVHEDIVKAGLGLVVIAFAVYNLAKPKLFTLGNENSAFIFGFFAGILGGAYNENGPPIVAYGTLRKWSPESFRATLQGYFLPTSAFILLAHGLGGLWTPGVISLFLYSIPVIFLAFVLGARLVRAIPPGKFDLVINIFLIVTGVMLLFK
jgi:hypothetical protein